MNARSTVTVLAVVGLPPAVPTPAIRIVRTGTTYTTVQLAVRRDSNGDTIEIDSGTYVQATAWATVNKNNWTILAVSALPARS